MRRFRWIILAAGLVVPAFLAVGVFGQGSTGVNTPVGYIWTYLGPTFGAGWAPPAQLTPGPPGPAGPASSCVNIVAYGAVGDDVFDNVAAFNAAKIANKCLTFPAGTFRFNSGVSWALSADNEGVTITGAGQDVTVLHFPNASGAGIAITKNKYNQSAHLRDFTMTTGTTNVDDGIRVTQTLLTPNIESTGYAQNDITRVTLRSSQGYHGSGVTFNWRRGVLLIDESVWDLIGVSVYGATVAGAYVTSGGTSGEGIVITGSTKGTGNQGVPVVFNISRANLNWLVNGLVIGQATQGFQVSLSNFTGCYAGITIPANGGELDQLAVTTSQFNNMVNLNIASTMNLIAFNSNTVYVPSGGYGILQNAPFRVAQITGNAFLGTAVGVGTGLELNPISVPDAAPAIITGNSFYRLAMGVDMESQSTGTLVTANMFMANAKNVQDLGSYTTAVTGATYNLAPAYAQVTGAVAAPVGTRLTVNSTTGFFNGQMVLVGGLAGINGIGPNQFLATPIRVNDATHMDLINISFSGTYASGGTVSSLPP